MQKPTVEFGRCMVTHELGKVVAIPLGVFGMSVPNIDTLRIEDGEPKIDFVNQEIEAQLTLSEAGLQALLDLSKSIPFEVKVDSPEVIYAWHMLFADGATRSRFERDEGGAEVEIKWAEALEHPAKLVQLSLKGRDDEALPHFTVVLESGKFYRNGLEIDLGWEGPVPQEGTRLWATRRVTQTMASGVEGIKRTIRTDLSSAVYWLGWKQGDLPDPNCATCMIAIDHHGNWRILEKRA